MEATHSRTSLTILAGLSLCTAGVYAAYRHAPHVGSWLPAQPVISAPQPPAPPEPPLSAAVAALGQGEVKLSAKLDRTAVLSGSDGIAHVELTMEAGADGQAEQAHQPTDVLIVLDVSGSMSGQKLDYAKQALHQLIERVAPSDRFGLITYESSAGLVIPLAASSGGAAARWHRTVDTLEASGGTNIGEGLELGLAQLAKREPGRNARVLLLSDGQATVGDTSIQGLRGRAQRYMRAEHVLSTLGIGDDFNEDVMTGLAETGTGNFYYLSKVALLGRFFDAELKAAGETVASALELRFEGAQDVKVLNVSGYELEHAAGQTVVRPGNLYAGQKRTLWVTLQLPTDRLRDLALGRFVLRYKHRDATRERSTGDLPQIACVADRERWKRSIDKSLWEQNLMTEQYQDAEMAVGRAVGSGDAAGIDSAVMRFSQNRQLAQELGSTKVLSKIDALEQQSGQAKGAAAAPAAQRSYEAKRMKSRAQFERRADAYNDTPLDGME
ncbi:MAG TPA: VWA domain-containing protein [Polyangiales bacterium]|nr:VWA domain-containing protein [Polyangiales bacterium]